MHRNHFFSRLYVRTILCAVLCGAVIFCFTGCGGGSGDDSASVQTTAEERGKGAEMDPEKKAQLQKDQENGLFLLVNKDPENHLDPSYKAEDLEPIKYYAADRNKYTRFMRAEAAEAFHRLVETAAEEGIDIVMTTAYRSYEFQQILWDNSVAQKGEEEANKTTPVRERANIRPDWRWISPRRKSITGILPILPIQRRVDGLRKTRISSDLFCAFRKIRRISRVILTNRGIFVM